MAASVGYPARVGGRLDPQLSRWRWLVKWLLAIPHYFVLMFLWIGFLVVSVVAFVAILGTGRYPRLLFEYNVGVLRWTWRVSYYTYGALGTDRYPPFSLADYPDYPATLALDYPERLSRGLVLVKWLLALPHLLLVGIFVSGGVVVVTAGDGGQRGSGPGLIGLLVLFAAVALAFTGRYPTTVFDLVLGLNRWVLRVGGYVGLMTDRYPPFRLDMGGEDPASVALHDQPRRPSQPQTASPRAPVPAGGGGQWPGGRVLALVLGCVLALFSLAAFIGGSALLAVDRIGRDGERFLGTGSARFTTSAHALVSESVEISDGGPGWVVADSLVGDARLRVTGRTAEPVFVGIARERDAARYLAGVAYDEVTDLDAPEYRPHPGTRSPALPEQQDIWVSANSGTGTQTVVWTPSDGRWVVVVMNPDGSPVVDVDADAAAELPVLTWIAVLMLVGGVVGLGIATIVILLAGRGPP